MMPQVTGLDRASLIASPDRPTPALARAKIGMMMKLVHGVSTVRSRLVMAIDSFIFQLASSTLPGLTESPVRTSSIDSNMRGPSRGRAGAIRPRATPAIVAWMPLRKVAYQTNTPAST